MQKVLQQIADNQHWQIRQATPVSGGDINHAFCLDTDKGWFFLKLNDAKRYPGMFAAEAVGLQTLEEKFSLKVPSVIAHSEADNQQYLLLEWLQPASYTTQSWESFGRALAQLHQSTNKQFGWPQSNYLGSLQMDNT